MRNAAYVAWQFPHVFVDLSHTMRIPGRLHGSCKRCSPVHQRTRCCMGATPTGRQSGSAIAHTAPGITLGVVLGDLSEPLE